MPQKMAERCLILAPHTDDGEIGCGGTIARLIDEGTEVYYLAFSAAEESVPDGFAPDALRREVIEATAVLGIPKENVMVRDFRVRHFPEQRQAILEDMWQVNSEIEPDLVLLPSEGDIHQDHEVVAAEGLRVFKRTTMLGYEEPWNSVVFSTRGFVSLTEQQIERKIEALQRYKTQHGRAYLNEEFLRSLARTRGTQIEQPYAEAFEVVRWVVK
jgi:LmbE family N-acetylglucosaminyl deacetylase